MLKITHLLSTFYIMKLIQIINCKNYKKIQKIRNMPINKRYTYRNHMKSYMSYNMSYANATKYNNEKIKILLNIKYY